MPAGGAPGPRPRCHRAGRAEVTGGAGAPLTGARLTRGSSQFFQQATGPLPDQVDHPGQVFVERPGDRPVPVGQEGAHQEKGGVLKARDHRAVRHQGPGEAGQGHEAAMIEVEAERGGSDVFQFVGLVENDQVMRGQ